MFGESLVAIPLSFESTKYLTIEGKMKTLLWNRQEALVAQEAEWLTGGDRHLLHSRKETEFG